MYYINLLSLVKIKKKSSYFLDFFDLTNSFHSYYFHRFNLNGFNSGGGLNFRNQGRQNHFISSSMGNSMQSAHQPNYYQNRSNYNNNQHNNNNNNNNNNGTSNTSKLVRKLFKFFTEAVHFSEIHFLQQYFTRMPEVRVINFLCIIWLHLN